MILKLAGASGSGKSSLVRALMSQWKFEPVMWPGKTKIKEYTAKVQPGQLLSGVYNRVVVLGAYTSACGGMDGVSDTNDRYTMVAGYAGPKHKRTLVLSEGLIYGEVYGITEGLGALSEQRSSGLWTYAFMDTPLDVCLERCRQRRAARGVTEPLNPHNTTMKHKAVQCVERRVRAGSKPNHLVYVVNHKHTPAKAARELCKALEAYERSISSSR